MSPAERHLLELVAQTLADWLEEGGRWRDAAELDEALVELRREAERESVENGR